MANTSIDIEKQVAPAPRGDVFQSMRHEMERLFDRFGGFDLPSFGRDIEHFWPRINGGALSVSVDVAEDDKAYTITAELPGIDEKDIDVDIAEDVLTLKGEKRAEKEEKNKNHYVRERSYGAFERSFALPADVDTDKIDAKFAKGVLTVVLPKNPRAEAAKKKIAVKAA
jgi:HSP20 family protein